MPRAFPSPAKRGKVPTAGAGAPANSGAGPKGERQEGASQADEGGTTEYSVARSNATLTRRASPGRSPSALKAMDGRERPPADLSRQRER